MPNPLDPVVAWFDSARDALRVTQRVLTQAVPGAITSRHSAYFGRPITDCAREIETAKQELERVTVLALTAIFERTLRDHLVIFPTVHLPVAPAIADAVRQEVIKDVEFWNISSRVVDLFQVVNVNLRGRAKQIIDYRNWVAHGLTIAKPPPSNVVAALAYKDLTAFLIQAGLATP